jgi:hypothetical protein
MRAFVLLIHTLPVDSPTRRRNQQSIASYGQVSVASSLSTLPQVPSLH